MSVVGVDGRRDRMMLKEMEFKSQARPDGLARRPRDIARCGEIHQPHLATLVRYCATHIAASRHSARFPAGAELSA